MALFISAFLFTYSRSVIADDFTALSERCAPLIHPETMRALVSVESSFNPFAIGVVGGHLSRQPETLEEAISTTEILERKGYGYSVGLAQIYKDNLRRVGLDQASAFNPCNNLHAGETILKDCYDGAKKQGFDTEKAMQAALSCYYSGNYTTGLTAGYVEKVVRAATGKSSKDKKTISVVKANTGKKTKGNKSVKTGPGEQDEKADPALIF